MEIQINFNGLKQHKLNVYETETKIKQVKACLENFQNRHRDDENVRMDLLMDAMEKLSSLERCEQKKAEHLEEIADSFETYTTRSGEEFAEITRQLRALMQ